MVNLGAHSATARFRAELSARPAVALSVRDCTYFASVRRNENRKISGDGMDARLEVTLELPPKELQPNARPHWRSKATKTKAYRKHAKDEAMAAAYEAKLTEPIKDAAVSIRYYNKTARVIDRDNIIASLKAAFDGFTDAGIWTDDRDSIYLPPERRKDALHPRVEIVIRAVDPDFISKILDI